MSTSQSQADLPWYRYSNVFNIKNTGQTVIVNCKGTRFSLHLGIIGEHSEYFQRCFKHPFKERASAEVTIDHLDPQTLGVYFNLVYRLASQPATITTTSKGDRAAAPHLVIPISFWYDGTLSQIINLHDTCDYLLDTRLMHYVREIIYNFLNSWRHRSQNYQRSGKLMTFRSFAEAYDLCDGEYRGATRELFQERILKAFTSGVTPSEWRSEADTIIGHPKFVLEVSKVFISKLVQLGRLKDMN